MGDDSGDLEREALEDIELVDRARSGGRDAYAVLWSKHQSRALAAARTLAGSDAEDVVSEAFTVVWERLQEGRGPRGEFRPYLLAAVRNLAARSYKRGLRTITSAEMEEGAVEEGVSAIEYQEDVRDVVSAFESLPERWRNVLWLSTVQELPRADIAAELKTSPNTTTQLLRRAKEGLRVAWLTQRVPLVGSGVHHGIAGALPRYVRGGWSERKRTEIHQHLAACADCREVEIKLLQESARLARMPALIMAGLALAVPGSIVSGAGVTPSVALGGGLLNRIQQAGSEALYMLRECFRGVPLITATRSLMVGGVILSVTVLGMLSSPSSVGFLQGQSAATTADGDGGSELGERGAPQKRQASGSDADATAGTDADADAAEEVEEKPVPEAAPSEAPPEYALTIAFAAPATGTVAPVLQGAADPGLGLALLITGQRIEIPVNADGTWSFDLAGVNLGAGTHSVSAAQTRADAEVKSTAALNFELLLPEVRRDAGDAASTVQVLARAGSQVCFMAEGEVSSRVRVGASGQTEVVLSAAELSSQPVEFRYCDGGRFGAVGQAYVS